MEGRRCTCESRSTPTTHLHCCIQVLLRAPRPQRVPRERLLHEGHELLWVVACAGKCDSKGGRQAGCDGVETGSTTDGLEGSRAGRHKRNGMGAAMAGYIIQKHRRLLQNWQAIRLCDVRTCTRWLSLVASGAFSRNVFMNLCQQECTAGSGIRVHACLVTSSIQHCTTCHELANVAVLQRSCSCMCMG